MMKAIILLVLFLLVLTDLRLLYLTQRKNCPLKEAWLIILADIERAYRYLKEKLHIYISRKTQFLVIQDLVPFRKSVNDLSICKYFNGSYSVNVNEDIWELHFTIRGISSEYTENLEDLRILLGQVLQDFYKERLGYIQYPFVYVTHIQEGEAVFWVAKNLYGNDLIRKRSDAENQKDAPNTEDLEVE